jgi:protocatechuate 3,4-dioxygenase alpha subunit
VPLRATPSQTVGPFFKIGLEPLYGQQLVEGSPHGERIDVQGRIIDGDGNSVPDAVLEIWQADSGGAYLHQEDSARPLGEGQFTGFGRIPTDENGAFRFSTIKPGAVASPDGRLQAPHIAVSLFMRGLLVRLVTRIYFDGDDGNAHDAVLRSVPESRRATLLAKKMPDGDHRFEWNVILQGPGETVFFDC